MRRLQIKFPNQIRISGWDFGSSARAMNQAGGKDSLMTYESVSKTQADLEKVSKSTTERKSMSTKTTIKRIALVAVSALGLGMVSTVSASAADTLGTLTGTGTASTATAGVQSVSVSIKSQAVRVNNTSYVVAKFTGPAVTAYSTDTGTVSTGGFSTGDKINPNIKLLAKGSSLSAAAITPVISAAGSFDGTVIHTVATADPAVSSSGGDFGTQIIIGTTGATANKDTAVYAGFRFTPDYAGTYSFLIWDDTNRDGSVSSAEQSTVYTVVVADAIASITTSTVINNAAADATNTKGAVIKVNVKDVNGNATVPTNETILLSVTGSALWGTSFVPNSNVSGSGTNKAYLTDADFDKDGNAFLALYNTTAETVAISASIIGAITTPTTTSTTATFITPTGYVSSVAVTDDVTTTAAGTVTGQYYTYGADADLTFTMSAASVKVALGLIDASGYAWGNSNIVGTTVVTADTSSEYNWVKGVGTTLPGVSYKLTWGASATADPATTYTTGNTGGLAVTSQLTKSTTAASFAVTPSSQTVATGSSPTFVVTLTDDYGTARAGVLVTAALSGSSRNSAVLVPSKLTDANGKASFTFTDASTSTTNLSDSITFTSGADAIGGTTTVTATVSYVAGLTVSTVTVTTSDSTKSVANLVSAPKDILAGKAGAATTANAIYAYVTTSNGAVAGIPVTFSVAGTGAAIPSTKVIAYTDSTGMATSAVYGWITGKYTVTATAGGVSGTGVQAFSQQSTSEARTVSATTTGSVVTASVKDRFGNGVVAARVYATATGGAYFGNGTTSTYGDTGLAGTVDFVVNGAGSVTVSTTNPADATQAALGQTDAPKGYATNSATAAGLALTKFTASAAGDASTIETGVGASYDAAGVASATVEVTSIGSSDSVDAANEATDAANAATDAANAAAEAADAATAAAQDAQAAVAELATKVASLIAGIKAQITTLTNLVIKIQKKVRA